MCFKRKRDKLPKPPALDPNIVKLVVGEGCMETYPCQHWVDIHYSNGDVKTCINFSTEIEQYKNLIEPEKMKEHFN